MPIRPPILAALSAAALAFSAQAQEFNGRQVVESFWTSKGVPAHVAQGIADRVGAESGYSPTGTGDGYTSFGLYQHHADRMRTLLAAIENDQAFNEVMGDDPVAAAHWAEIKGAPTRGAAAKLWDRYFERSAGSQRDLHPVGAAVVKRQAESPSPAATRTAAAVPSLSNPFIEPVSTTPGAEMVFSLSRSMK